MIKLKKNRLLVDKLVKPIYICKGKRTLNNKPTSLYESFF